MSTYHRRRNRGGTGGSAPKFHGGPHPRYTCKCIAISAKPSSVAMSAPPPIKKLKQTTLSFHTTNSVETLVILETKLCDYKLLNYIEFCFSQRAKTQYSVIKTNSFLLMFM